MDTDIQLDHQFLIKTLQKLIQINSVNPMLDPRAPGEEEIGSFIAQILQDMGLKPEIDNLKPGRVNVTAVIKGTGSGRSLMINGHMDTVGVHNMKEPFSGEISVGRIFGRGSMDMKGGLAGTLTMAKAGIDTVIIGPKGSGLHSKEEWVDIQSVIDLAAVLYRVILDFCC